MARPIPDLEPMTASEAAVDDVVIIDDTSDAETKKMSVDQLLKLIIPTGLITPFGGPNAPDGFLLCDGAAVSRTTYADLFAVVGESYGVGDGSNTFNLPNLKGRVPVGLDTSQSEFDTLGKSGGENEHVLTIAEMPVHSHPPIGGSSFIVYNNSLPSGQGTGNGAKWEGRGTTGDRGGGEAHNNLQPYNTVQYVIKT